MGDGAVKPCPKCGKKKARRMLGTGAGLIFKGSGFYTTDSKGGGRKPEAPDGDAKKPAAEKEKEKKKEEKEPKK